MQEHNKGFFGRLFDLSFDEFITPGIIGFLFALAIVGAGILAVMFIFGGFAMNRTIGTVYIFLGVLVFFAYVILARIWSEFLIVIFKIAENTGGLGRPVYAPSFSPSATPPLNDDELNRARPLMHDKTDSQLMAILANKADYKPEAVQAALEESRLRSRKEGLGGAREPHSSP
jgi:hypothetical protein